MTKHSAKYKPDPPPSLKMSLFYRIVLRLSLPLILLGAIFSAIQLSHQLRALNELQRIESQLALQAAHDTLTALFEEPGFEKSTQFKNHLQSLAAIHRIHEIQVYDLQAQKFLAEEPPEGWTVTDQAAAEKSLEQRREGKIYAIRVDKESERLIAYLPVETSDGNLLIARLAFSLSNVEKALRQSRSTLGLIILFILLTGMLIARSLSKAIIRPLKTLNLATREIMEGHLGKHVEIHTGDEIETLAYTFNQMSDKLKEMKQRAEDANPLTQLPGNQGIFHELGKRIHERQKFVFFHTDINRFKVFNDHYGLGRGDEVIKKTAEVLKKAVEVKGSPSDFVGHQGGDDFVVITHPSHADAVGAYVCELFTKEVVLSVYRKEDIERGYVEQIDRRRLTETGEERMAKFPLVSLGLAGVTNTKRDFADYFDCMERAVSAKKDVKKIIESAYIIKD